MIKARVFTALCILPILLWPLILAVDTVWLGMLLLFVILSCFELTTLCVSAFSSYGGDHHKGSVLLNTSSNKHSVWMVSVVMSGGVWFLGLVFASNTVFLALLLVVMACWVICGPLLLGMMVPETLLRMMLGVFVCVYGCLPWLCIWKIYLISPHYVLYLIAVVMGSDTGGYLAGRFFGNTPFAPLLSPKKTWEGTFGAIGVAVGISGGVSYVLQLFDYPMEWLVITVLTAIFSITGDLLESSIKRFAQVKDSGRLLPGHGGFLDRADGFMLAAPLLWLLLTVRGWW